MVNKNILGLYGFVDEPEKIQTYVFYMTRIFPSQFQTNEDGTPKMMRGITFTFCIGMTYASYLFSLFKDGNEPTFLELFGFSAKENRFIGKGFHPTATTFVPVDQNGLVNGVDFKPGDPVELNVNWRLSKTFPNKMNPDFPNDETKKGLKLDVIPKSLKPLPSVKPKEFPFEIMKGIDTAKVQTNYFV